MSDFDQASIFTAPSGRRFVYLSEMPATDGQVLYGPETSTTLYTLIVLALVGNAVKHRISFHEPHDGSSGTLTRIGDAIHFGGEMYTRRDSVSDLSAATTVPLPSGRVPEYLCQAPDGTFVYVSVDPFGSSSDLFREYVGDGMTMREVPIRRVMRITVTKTVVLLTQNSMMTVKSNRVTA